MSVASIISFDFFICSGKLATTSSMLDLSILFIVSISSRRVSSGCMLFTSPLFLDVYFCWILTGYYLEIFLFLCKYLYFEVVSF